MTSFELLQVVELIDDFPSKGVVRGSLGTIVEKFDVPSEAYDIEIVSGDGTAETLLPSVRPDQIRLAKAMVS